MIDIYSIYFTKYFFSEKVRFPKVTHCFCFMRSTQGDN